MIIGYLHPYLGFCVCVCSRVRFALAEGKLRKMGYHPPLPLPAWKPQGFRGLIVLGFRV